MQNFSLTIFFLNPDTRHLHRILSKFKIRKKLNQCLDRLSKICQKLYATHHFLQKKHEKSENMKYVKKNFSQKFQNFGIKFTQKTRKIKKKLKIEVFSKIQNFDSKSWFKKNV